MPSAVNTEHTISKVIRKSDNREVPQFRVLHHLGLKWEKSFITVHQQKSFLSMRFFLLREGKE